MNRGKELHGNYIEISHHLDILNQACFCPFFSPSYKSDYLAQLSTAINVAKAVFDKTVFLYDGKWHQADGHHALKQFEPHFLQITLLLILNRLLPGQQDHYDNLKIQALVTLVT